MNSLINLTNHGDIFDLYDEFHQCHERHLNLTRWWISSNLSINQAMDFIKVMNFINMMNFVKLRFLSEVNYYNQVIHLMKLMSDECNENNQFHQIDHAHQILWSIKPKIINSMEIKSSMEWNEIFLVDMNIFHQLDENRIHQWDVIKMLWIG